MPLEDGRRDALDRLAVGDVADLVLAVELRGELAQAILAPREQHAVPAVAREPPSERRADAARRAGDDRYRQTRTLRVVRASRPAASRTTAESVCLPRFAPRRRPRRRVERRRRCPWLGRRACLPSKNVIVRIALRRVGRDEQGLPAPVDARAAVGREPRHGRTRDAAQPERREPSCSGGCSRPASSRSSTPGSRTRAPGALVRPTGIAARQQGARRSRTR